MKKKNINNENKYKEVAAEERWATFCPLIITVDGVAHASFQAFLRCVSAQLSAKWRRPLSSVTNGVRVQMQISLIRTVDLRSPGLQAEVCKLWF